MSAEEWSRGFAACLRDQEAFLSDPEKIETLGNDIIGFMLDDLEKGRVRLDQCDYDLGYISAIMEELKKHEAAETIRLSG